MEEVPPPPDVATLLEAASEFATHPGAHSDDSVREFLERFPLPLILSALQNKRDVPGLESSLTSCLERIFKTSFGAALIPHYIHFLQAGMLSDSQMVKCLACKVVCFFLGNTDDRTSAVHLILAYDIYRLLVDCLINGDELVAAASSDAIKKLGSTTEGLNVILHANEGDTSLKKVASQCSSLARVRILALLAKLFSLSDTVALEIYNSGLLSLFEAEIGKTNDMLTTLSALELMYELAESPYSSRFLLKTSLLQLLSTIISMEAANSSLRSRAMLLSGKLLSAADTYSLVDENSVEACIFAIDRRLEFLKDHDTDECECALEALGRIGTSAHGASLLLRKQPLSVRRVIASAFCRSARGVALAALHAFGNITGVERTQGNLLLGSDVEECLQRLVYEVATYSSKLTPSGLFLTALQKDSDFRLAAYRLISALVCRQWCLIEVCSKQEIIDVVTDPRTETVKSGMEARHACCVAISTALFSTNMANDPSLAGTIGKLQEAVRRGPYLPRRQIEAQPIVVTAERF